MTQGADYIKEIASIAKAGEMYREAKIKFVAETFHKSEDEVRAAVDKALEVLKGGNGQNKSPDEYQKRFQEFAAQPSHVRGSRFKNFLNFANGCGIDRETVEKQLRDYDRKLCKVAIVCAKDIKPEPVKWLWKGWLARGKIEIAAGTKGDGKTTLGLSLASTVSCGGKWPDSTIAEMGKVLIWSGEDGAADTIIPRLIAMGADLNNIFILSTVTERDGEKRPFDPSTDLAALEDTIARIGGVDLVIIDPFVSAVTRGKNSHNNAETRQGLQHVVDFAEKHDCAVLGIHHLTKGTVGRDPLDRVTGSLAFTALARIVLATVTRKESESEGPPRMLLRVASNLGPSGGGFGYDIEMTILHEPAIEVSRIKWLEEVEGDAHELMAEAEEVKDKSDSALAKACEFLREILKVGPKSAKEMERRFADAGHSEKTIRRAKAELKIKSFRNKTTPEVWMWTLPEHEPF